MYETIKKFCENKDSNGLFLIDMPTGFGKTYNVVKYIFDACLKPENVKRNFFFITTLRKNLPEPELQEWFHKTGQDELFKKKFLRIDSNIDCVLENFIRTEKQISDDITRSVEYKTLARDVHAIKNLEHSKDCFSILNALKDNFREKTEPAFRRFLQKQLNALGTVKQKLDAIKNDKKWKWVGELYPAVFTSEKQIIFMSVDKFLGRNSTIVEPSYMFYNSDIIKDAFIFIDEFDATKETLLNNIIDNGLRDQVDYIDLFLTIYSALQIKEFPEKLIQASKQRQCGEYKNQSLQSLIEEIKEDSQEIFKNFSLKFSHRTKSDLKEEQNFLFQDHQYHAILDGNKSYVSLECNSKEKVNDICFLDEKPNDERQTIQYLLGKIRYFVKHFQTDVYILALNFLQCKQDQRKEGDDDFSLEYAVRSVLELFRLSDKYVDYLTSQILIGGHKIKGNIQSGDMDLSFYNNGFRYYAFENSPANDLQSRMMMLSFQTTPEKMLLRFCEKAKVIGISATATVPSVIGNYDLNYLHSKMQNLFPSITPDEQLRLSNDFENAQSGYSNVKITAELFGSDFQGKYNQSSWKKVFDNDEIVESIYNKLEIELPEARKAYCKERYLRIALAFKRFCEHDDIKSFLCVLMKHPGDDKDLNRNTLCEIFNMIMPNGACCVRWLNGTNFDAEKVKIQRELSQDKKLFVVSVYATLGAGQNLQYDIPKSLKNALVCTNKFKPSKQKDFDAIYLDKPTNLLVNLTNNLESKEFIKYLYQVEFLQECTELSMISTMKHVRKAFKTYTTKMVQPGYVESLYDTNSYKQFATRAIIQAVGRICRTNQKQKHIYIYADSQIADVLDFRIDNRRLLNKEFLALLNECRKSAVLKEKTVNLSERASLTSIRVNKDILNLLADGWNDYKIGKWKSLRELVLKQPTMSRDEVRQNFAASNYYIELPQKGNVAFYKQEGDFNNIQIAFNRQNGYNRESAEVAKLDQMLKIEGVAEYFRKEGYAATFAPNDFIMSPPLWNNIYKGALGEVVGKFLFKKLFDINLEDIQDKECFELFDFKVKDKPIYVDFKDWNESTEANQKMMVKKIISKAEKCNCRLAIIANIVADGEYRVLSQKFANTRILVIPALYIRRKESILPYNAAWDAVHKVMGAYSD